MLYLPFIGAFLQAVSTILEKKILKKHEIDYKNFTVYAFLSVVIVSLPFIYFLWSVKPEALEFQNAAIFIFVVFISILANLFVFYSLKRENVTEIEPIMLMQPLLTILIAYFFSFFFIIYAPERNPSILFLALIASTALIASHIKKHHLVFNKFLIAALIGNFLYALELVISRGILDYYNPITFYFIRSLFIFLVTLIAFQPHIKKIKLKTRYMILVTGAVWVIFRVMLYYGFITLGVIFTTMMFITAPVFVYLLAFIFLKEKIRWRQIISSIIIIICVLAAILIRHNAIILAYFGLT
jgi:drug/metabolite transporter (DMT)-like permease